MADIEYDVQDPPRRWAGVLTRLGPGLIIAGSIVGSGELIATTKTGAEAGFTLLWLIVLGCAIKVFVQVEIGRYTVTWGETALNGLNRVPGPRLKVNWLVWVWAIATILVLGQQGGIVGGVGQSLAIAAPLTERGETYNEVHNELTAYRMKMSRLRRSGDLEATAAERARVQAHLVVLADRAADLDEPPDSYLWAGIVTVITSAMLYFGRYAVIQAVSTLLVAAFTLTTIITVIALQTKPDWAISGGEFFGGLVPQLPASTGTAQPIATALAAFGIIGVGAFELIMYPYWCLEKGYAKFTGPRDGEGWAERARGWMRIMRIDAWGSMIIYTFATVAFYLLGAAVLWRTGLNPSGGEMVRTLSQMYVPVFGEWADGVFLIGAFAVLYSTFFVAAAGNARMVADGLGLMGLVPRDEASRLKWSRIIAAVWPLVAFVLLVGVQAPVAMVLASGVAQAMMLPMLGGAALWFRYRRMDPALTPNRAWDVCLWLSVIGFTIAGAWAFWEKVT